MAGAINKQFLTQELFSKYPEINEVYVDPKFKWTNKRAKFYLKLKGSIPMLVVVTRLNFIWGAQNATIRVTEEFDSLLLTDKRLVYSNGKWVGV